MRPCCQRTRNSPGKQHYGCVACAVITAGSPFCDWQDGRTLRRDEEADAEVLSRILGIISDMPSYGYRRVWGIMRRQLRDEGLPPVNAKRVYRVMSEHNLLLLHDKPQWPQREHNGKIAVAESNQRWCSDGFEFGCDDGEKLRVTFALDCCDREAIDWAASTGGYDSITVQDVMLGAVEKRFGATLPDNPVQWLTDNGSAYTAYDTRKFATELNLEACTTAVSSPQSNGMAERFVKTMKEDYIAFMPNSVLLYAPGSAHMVGLIEQQRWSRESDSYGKKHQRKQRPYEEKDSYKWQKASAHMVQRLGEIQPRVISVCDREADIWHYLDYKLSQGQRFVVRAAQNRLLT